MATTKDINEMAVSARLTREAGLLAGQLATLIAASMPVADGAVTGLGSEGHAFLQAMYESVGEGRPLSSWSRNPLDRRPSGTPHPLDRLSDQLHLSAIELQLLLLAGLSDEHEGLASVLRVLHPRGEPRATVGLAAQLFCGDQNVQNDQNGQVDRRGFRVLVETSALRTTGALRVSGDGPLFEQSLQLAEALWSALHGVEVWPRSVNRTGGPITSAGLKEWFAADDASRAVLAIERGETCTVMIAADNEDAAFDRALALVAHAGREPVGILLPAVTDTDLDNVIQVHALVRGIVPVVKFASLASTEGPAPAHSPLFANFPGVIVVCGRLGASTSGSGRPLVSVAAHRLRPIARRNMWSETIPSLSLESSFLAARYPVEPALASAVATDLNFASDIEKREPTVADVANSIRARGNISLSAGVKLLRARASWSDLVLPQDRLQQLREAVHRMEHQGRVFDEWGFLRDRAGARGVRLLFTGPPGTGKTLSAEVLAHTLNVDLLVVDLSRVVSKWIGETEKNLSAVFDAAERGQAALFFDEADALFGKRTEVSDAHDRYANLETAYLLQRLEQFEGLAILATNLRQNIDAAFLRRLEFVVDFEEPDQEERFALWRCHLPAGAPLAGDVNLYELAALYPVVGGVIRNAAVAAGFLAATDGTPIDRRHFVSAIRREYAKAGRSFPGAPIGLTV